MFLKMKMCHILGKNKRIWTLALIRLKYYYICLKIQTNLLYYGVKVVDRSVTDANRFDTTTTHERPAQTAS